MFAQLVARPTKLQRNLRHSILVWFLAGSSREIMAAWHQKPLLQGRHLE